MVYEDNSDLIKLAIDGPRSEEGNQVLHGNERLIEVDQLVGAAKETLQAWMDVTDALVETRRVAAKPSRVCKC
jgi:hypothetical protein